MAHKPKSLESALDEERRHVLALLEEARTKSSSNCARSGSATRFSLQPMRSMLQFDLPLPPDRTSTTARSDLESTLFATPTQSLLDTNSVVSPIKNTHSLPSLDVSKYLSTPYRSMLDVSPTIKSASFAENKSGLSARTTPSSSLLNVSTKTHNYLVSPLFHRPSSPRSLSNNSMLEISPKTICSSSFLERNLKSQIAVNTRKQKTSSLTAHMSDSLLAAGPSTTSNIDPDSACHLPMYLSSDTDGSLAQKQKTEVTKKNLVPSVMVNVAKGELFSLKDSGKFGSSQKDRKSKSTIPHSHFRLRNKAPKYSGFTKILISDERAPTSKRLQRRRSDASLARSSLTSSPQPVLRRRTVSATSTMPCESILDAEKTKKYEENAIIPSSDDSESDEDTLQGLESRNVFVTKEDKISDCTEHEKETTSAQASESVTDEKSDEASKKSNEREGRSDSLSEPVLVITEPNDRLMIVEKSNKYPKTSSDEGDSGSNVSYDSETEAGLSDIKRAQELPINITALISTPATSRCVRSIHRGDFTKMQQEARENQRPVRKYLVAVDLSEEAAHALEWTIGTVLRDGDTLLAIYCVDEEIGISTNDKNTGDKFQGHSPTNASNISKSISSPSLSEPMRTPAHSTTGSRTSSTSECTDRCSEKSRAEQERYRAVQDITDKVSEFLRRTKLQVKVVIEVIHCKSPKHLITEVIDFVSPTLVILGSRGRSALKGIILGSFSNYIVSKSSVPVMVARKRLRKPSKYKRPIVRLANNIENPHQLIDFRTLAAAKTG